MASDKGKKGKPKDPLTQLAPQPLVIPEGCWRGIIELIRLMVATIWVGGVIWLVVVKQEKLAMIISGSFFAIVNAGKGQAAITRTKDRLLRNVARFDSVKALMGMFPDESSNNKLEAGVEEEKE